MYNFGVNPLQLFEVFPYFSDGTRRFSWLPVGLEQMLGVAIRSRIIGTIWNPYFAWHLLKWVSPAHSAAHSGSFYIIMIGLIGFFHARDNPCPNGLKFQQSFSWSTQFRALRNPECRWIRYLRTYLFPNRFIKMQQFNAPYLQHCFPNNDIMTIFQSINTGFFKATMSRMVAPGLKSVVGKGLGTWQLRGSKWEKSLNVLGPICWVFWIEKRGTASHCLWTATMTWFSLSFCLAVRGIWFSFTSHAWLDGDGESRPRDKHAEPGVLTWAQE